MNVYDDEKTPPRESPLLAGEQQEARIIAAIRFASDEIRGEVAAVAKTLLEVDGRQDDLDRKLSALIDLALAEDEHQAEIASGVLRLYCTKSA